MAQHPQSSGMRLWTTGKLRSHERPNGGGGIAHTQAQRTAIETAKALEEHGSIPFALGMPCAQARLHGTGASDLCTSGGSRQGDSQLKHLFKLCARAVSCPWHTEGNLSFRAQMPLLSQGSLVQQASEICNLEMYIPTLIIPLMILTGQGLESSASLSTRRAACRVAGSDDHFGRCPPD